MTFLAGEVDGDLLALFGQVFSAAESPTVPQPRGLDLDLWSTLRETGLSRLTGAESEGGSGGSLADGVALFRTAAYYAVRAPVGEHDFLAGWLADTAGLSTAGFLTLAVTDSEDRALLPWARDADTAVLLVPAAGHHRLVVRDIADGALTCGENLAGEPRDLVTWSGPPRESATVEARVTEELRLRLALLKAAQMAGALARVLDLCVEHATVRVQFGRPLAAFQAVQHLTVDIAGQVRLTEAAVAHATRMATVDWHSTATRFAVAVACSVAGHAATTAVRNAHQVHGAIGTTTEHRLHELTTRLLAWRGEAGSTAAWNREVAAIVAERGSDRLWDLLTLQG